MNHIRHFRLLLLTALLCGPLMLVRAQSVKNLTVSQGNPYTDHIALKDDSRDMELMVKFAFDEPTNTLSVTLISYRALFVFPTDTPLRQALKGRKVRPDKLPFVVDSEPGSTYELTKDYFRSLPKPTKKHVFKKWIDGNGLTPQPAECKMVNDYVSQNFVITGKANAVTVSLRDVMMLERELTAKVGKRKYNIVWGRDINTDYIVYVKRNPCFGLDEELAAAGNQLTAISSAYNNLASRYGSGVVDSQESLANFKEMKQLLQGQYPLKTETSDCPNLQECWDNYNLYVDSIAQLTCRVKAPVKKAAASDGAGSGKSASKKAASPGRALNAGYILTQARQIDNAVNRWLNTKDAMERADLRKQCAAIIKNVRGDLGNQRGATAAQQNAIRIFNQAVNYYNSVCR